MFGGDGVPHWRAFTIGHDIVCGYLRLHPHTTWAALTPANANVILAGSRYQPCST
jgi:hypothetical protein